ncbi:extracellular solute-binding protein [Caldanaerobius fijiensis DSM 17918]|uniref:Extracellular solute-binding protein n=1 Tax=Caldanaerobius fijiensis DSM 17918 TaxID=1121256 RepID=A0A1M4WKQ5_9THEO|nr:ABC transporter substrate-binding protein [Caldanaerobius fijiensis]SHE81796.1 extracellular solute-binding protein [Caldanaerobius fijiensis DSM 17918]
MSNVRRLFSIIMIIAMIGALLLSGCGSKNTKQTTSSGEKNKSSQGASQETKNTNTSEVTEVTFWHSDWGVNYMNHLKATLVDTFNKTHKNVQVKLVIMPNGDGVTGFDKKITAAIAGGSPPDVLYIDRFAVGEWAAKGLIEDISDLVKRDGINADDYYKACWDETIFNGKQYAMPYITDARGLFYNKTLFKKAGLDPSSPPKTIDELDQMAEKLTVKDANGNYTQLGYVPWWDQSGGSIYDIGFRFGGKFIDDKGNLTPNDPNLVKALEWAVGYAKKYGYDKVNQMPGQLKLTRDAFSSGRLAMMYNGNFAIPSLVDPKNKVSFEWDTAPFPTVPGVDSASWGGGFSMAIPKGAKHRDAAWEFIKWATGKEGQMSVLKNFDANGNQLSAMPSVNEAYVNNWDPRYQVFVKELLPKNHYRPVTPVGQTLWNLLWDAKEKAYQGKGDPKALLDDVKKKIDAELAKPIYER